MSVTTRQFEMWGMQAEVVIRVKHENGTTIEVSVSDVTHYVGRSDGYGGYNEIRIPLKGEWFNRLVETTDFSSYKKGC